MPQTPTSWQQAPGAIANWSIVATGGGVRALMTWGPVIFYVWPLNYNEMDHESETDWAHKEIAGAAIYREWVGENDEIIHLRGEIFPYRTGGLTQFDAFESMRLQGVANYMMRGDGVGLGWFVCQKLVRQHSAIGFEGVGQHIHFEAIMARVPAAAGVSYLSTLWRAGVIPAEH